MYCVHLSTGHYILTECHGSKEKCRCISITLACCRRTDIADALQRGAPTPADIARVAKAVYASPMNIQVTPSGQPLLTSAVPLTAPTAVGLVCCCDVMLNIHCWSPLAFNLVKTPRI